MSNQPRLFRVNPETKETADLEEVEFAALSLQEPRDIQEWIADNPRILGDDLLIVAKEFSGFDGTRERLDLLAVDQSGGLVVIELKRDDSGSDTHWQAIKYASHLHSASVDDVVKMLSEFSNITEDNARQELIQHTDSDETLDRLNKSQRIILASHRFAPEVTSAALWLNEQARRNLVTCIQMIPYKDSQSDTLYLQTNTIIPTPGAEDYQIGVGNRSGDEMGIARRNYTNKTDSVTEFCAKVNDLVMNVLSDEVKPDKTSRWAGGHASWRHYNFWYSESGDNGLVQWGNWSLSYRIELTPAQDTDDSELWNASVSLYNDRALPEDLLARLREVNIADEIQHDHRGVWIELDAQVLDESFANTIAQGTVRLIEGVTPTVREFMESAG